MGAVLRGAGVMGAITTGGVGLAYISQIFLARVMGATEFGIYSYAWSWAALLVVPALLGFNAAILRFVPEYRAKTDDRRLFGVIRASQGIVLGFSVGLTLVGELVVFLLKDTMSGYYALPLHIALASIPLVAVMSMQSSFARAFGWVVLASFPRNIGAPLLLVAGVSLLLVVGYDATGVAVLGVALLSYLVMLPVLRMRLAERVAATVSPSPPQYEVGNWLRVAFPLFLLSGFQIVLDRSDLIMLGLFLAPDDVAIYQAAAKTSTMVGIMLRMLNFLGAPKIAGLFAEGRHDELQKLVSGIVGWVFWPSVLAVLVVLMFGGPILGLFGPEFEDGYLALAILALGKLIHATTGPVGYLMALTGHQNASAKVLGTCAVVNIVLNLALIPHFQLVGAAIATAFTMALWNLWLLVLVRRRLSIHSFVIPWPLAARSGADG